MPTVRFLTPKLNVAVGRVKLLEWSIAEHPSLGPSQSFMHSVGDTLI